MNSGTIAGLTSAPLKTKGWNFISKTLTSTAVSLVSPATIVGPSDNNLTVTSGSFSVTSTARRPRNLNLIGANSVGSPDYTASAGSINLLAGNATFVTQASSGGNIIIKAGLSNSYLGSTSGNGGNVEISSGTGGDGNNANANGYLLIYTPDALANGVSATSSGYTPGDLTILAGGANYTAGGTNLNRGGNINITTRMGNSRSSVNGTICGNGGAIICTLGNGGSGASAVTGLGGNGGSYTISGGAGGNATGAGGTQTGGNGSAISFTSGGGGAAVSASGTRTGGNSGAITLSTGQGGNGTTVNGNSGSITISTGLAGAGAGSAGVSGSILFNTGSTNQITISPEITTITNQTRIQKLYIPATDNSLTPTLNATDAGNIISYTNSSPITLSLPSVGTVSVGYQVVIIQDGAGLITIANNGNTVKCLSTTTPYTFKGQYGKIQLICVASNTYHLSGDIV